MIYQLEWRNESQTMLAKIQGNHTTLIEPEHPEWDELVAADDIAPYVPPEVDLGAQARAQRNSLLAASDWTQVADAPVDAAAWAAYRQALRDVPQQDGFPSNVEWPSKP